jgi:hypothetical protein
MDSSGLREFQLMRGSRIVRMLEIEQTENLEFTLDPE